MNLTTWIEQNWLDVKFIEPDLLFEIPDVGKFLVIKPKDGLLFDDTFNIILDDFEAALAESVDYFTFCFGGQWYYYSKDKDPELIPLKYIGKAKIEL